MFLGLILVGAVIGATGIVVSTFVNQYTSTESFCTSCHSMVALATDPHFQRSAHRANAIGVLANCSDCHVPSTNWFVETYKHASAGIRDVIAEYTSNISDPAVWHARLPALAEDVREQMRSEDSVTCRKCHNAARRFAQFCNYLDQGQVRPFGDQLQNLSGELFQRRNASAARPRRGAPLFTPALQPLDRRRHAHRKLFGRLAPRRADIHRRDEANSQATRIAFGISSPLMANRCIKTRGSLPVGNLTDSNRTRTALAGGSTIVHFTLADLDVPS